MSRRFLGLVAVLATVFAFDTTANAEPILYRYTGIGSGSLGSSSFESASFTIRASADTDNIATWVDADLQNTHLSTSIEIDGLGTVDITTPSHTWIDQACCGGIGEDLSSNWITIDESGLFGYGLDTDLGPIVDTSPLDVVQFSGVSTSGGSLTFDSISSVTFVATVPEPGLSVLLAIAVAPLLARRRSWQARGTSRGVRSLASPSVRRQRQIQRELAHAA
jgi:hypothetical protein